jgi:hypothetical protein
VRKTPLAAEARLLVSLLKVGAQLLAGTRKRVVVLGTLTVLLASVVGAVAYFAGVGTGSASASVGSFGKPSITGALPGAGTVDLSWSTVTAPTTGPVTYSVSRDGGDAGGDCPTAASSTTATACTDSGLGAGSHTYTVTAHWRSWTSTSDTTTVNLSSGAATKLVFTTGPQTAQVTQLTGTITVQRQDTGDNPTTSGAIVVGLSSTSGGGLFRDTADNTTITSVQIPDGSSSASFKYRDANAGSPVITASSGSLTSAQQTETISKGDQTISFGALGDKRLDQSPITLSASASSGLSVAFTSATTATCTVTGSTITLISVGTCTINANQVGDANWNAASQVQQSFTVSKGNQTINFAALADKRLDQSPTTLSASASSGLSVTFTSATTPTCTVTGSTITLVTVGTCTINANQAGDANWNAASQVQQSFTVNKGNQTISFTALADKRLDQGPITLTASASSGLSVAFTSATTATCTVSGSTVTLVNVGTCTINANQAGNANWNAASQVQQSFTVNKGNQTINFTSSAPASATVGGATYTPTASASSGLTVTFTIDATASSVCSISGGVVSFTAAGTCVVDANQAGSANWNAAPQVQQSFSVSNPAPLTILSVVRDGGNKKVHFTGSGAVASTTITVTICAVNSFPCAAPVATSISTNPSAGAWTSAASNSNLNGSQTYYARAVQGSRTSAVFTFSTTSL